MSEPLVYRNSSRPAADAARVFYPSPAITAHRRARNKIGLASTLEAIPGIGPQRRKALLKAFGSIDRIRKASVDALAAVPGMTHKAAQRVKECL